MSFVHGQSTTYQITLYDIIRRVRSKLNEPATPTAPFNVSAVPRFWTDTELTDWVNDGLRDVARRTETLFTYSTSIAIQAYMATPFTDGVVTYPLPQNVVRINRVEFVPYMTTNQIYVVQASTQNEMDQIWGTYQQNQSTYPRWFVTRGFPGGTGDNAFSIQLYPQSSQAGNLNLFYWRLPDRIPDPVLDPASYNQVIDLPNGWDDMVVEYATFQALQKNKDGSWQQLKQEYEDKVAQMVDVTRKYHDQQSYIGYGTNYLPEWLTGGGEW